MKTRSTLSERASNIRSDYAPLAAPPNPRAGEARAAMREYMLPTLASAPKSDAAALPMNDEVIGTTSDAHTFDYHLTWPGNMRGVATVDDQWDYTDTGEIEAWYTRDQLEAAIAAMAFTTATVLTPLDTATVGRGVERDGVVVVEVLGIDS